MTPWLSSWSRSVPLLSSLLLLLCGGLDATQDHGSLVDRATEVSVPTAVRSVTGSLRTGEIRIDGIPDEEAWNSASVVSGFVQREPNEGEPAGQDTAVRVLFDDNAIYVAARMFEDDPAVIRAPLVRRGQGGMDQDWINVAFDTNLDGRTAYRFQVNAAGVQVDWYLYDDDQSDGSWDAVWESAVNIDSHGWTAELRIPLSQIRYESSIEPQTWGVQFMRSRSAASEVSFFAPQRQAISGVVSQYGRLEGVRLSTATRRMEARPYVLGNFHNGPVEEGNPFFDGRDVGFRVGSDFRFGLGSAFTIATTINPDFGQVDADPAEINLTAFESFFDERRPFFIEDAQIFQFELAGPRNQLFYSRRIGRAPQLRASIPAAFLDIPDAATIGGAGKITGRTPGGLSIGALAAVTRTEYGRALPGEGDSSERFLAEPRSGFGLATIQQDFRGGASQVRALLTAVHRDFPEGSPVLLPEDAYTGGVAIQHQWNNRAWRVDGSISGSHVRGSPRSITAVQRRSNHYFQRPDATRTTLDSMATSLSGAEWRIQLTRQDREHWNGRAWIGQVTSGFEVNDLGFSTSRERLDGGLSFGYRQLRPGTLFRSYNVDFTTIQNFSHEVLDNPRSWASWRDAHTNGTFRINSNFTLLDYKEGSIEVAWQPDLHSRSATRGGPVMLEPSRLSGSIGVNTDRRQNTNISASLGLERGAKNSGDELSFQGTLNMRPSSRLQLELSPRVSTRSDGMQYVTTTSVLPYDDTFGNRYFFGGLQIETVAVQARANYTISPTLSIQTYVEPFISSGVYSSYKQLRTPGTFDFIEFQEGSLMDLDGSAYCIDGSVCRDPEGTRYFDFSGDGSIDFVLADRNFNRRSLFGNAVLRWEYRPGSTVIVVWQRQQQVDELIGDLNIRRDMHRLLTAPAHDRLIVKVNYWYNF